jgi:hypothetical protein
LTDALLKEELRVSGNLDDLAADAKTGSGSKVFKITQLPSFPITQFSWLT